MSLCQKAGAKVGEAIANEGIALVAWHQGNLEEAKTRLRANQEVLLSIDDPYDSARDFYLLSFLAGTKEVKDEYQNKAQAIWEGYLTAKQIVEVKCPPSRTFLLPL